MSRAPRIQVPPWSRNRAEWAYDLIAHGALAFTLYTVITSYGELPDQIPTHFDGSGQPDGYGSRSSLIWLLGLSTAMWAGLWFAARIPHLHNYPFKVTEQNAAALYAVSRELMFAVRAAVQVMFAYILHGIVAVAMGDGEGLGPAVALTILPIIVLLIVYMTRMSTAAKTT